MVKVEYFGSASMRKTGKMKPGDVRGTFWVNIEPKEIPEVPEVDPNLKGAVKKSAEKKREELVAKRDAEVAEELLRVKFIALDKVRELTGHGGVLVANIGNENEEEK